MSLDILVPVLPESVSDATLVVWHKKTGDWVNEGDNLADLETDKVILEVPAPHSGILQSIQIQGGEVVVSGQVLAQLEIQQQQQAKTVAKDEPTLSPSVRRLVAETEVDPNAISGSGKHGRILKADVEDYLSKQQTTANTSLRAEQRVPMTRLRAKVAERLLQAQQNAAMLTTFNEVNLKAVIDLRNQYKHRFEDKHSIKLGFMSFFVKS
jgi:2-oxoglutarate dehydrogenase E2 component (dihydrolipoamide succinyltransferase)